MRQIYSTAEIPEGDRLAHWVDTVCGTFIRVDCEPRRDHPFFGEISINSAGEARAGMVRSTAQLINRSAQEIARDPEDVFNLGLQTYGRAHMRQGDRKVACCHRNLTNPSMTNDSITELAFAARFNDFSYFSLAYKAHYGRSPRDVRHESMEGRGRISK